MKNILFLLFWISILTSCSKQSQNYINDSFHVRRDGADLPVWVHGNDDKNTFLVVLHGAGSFGHAFRDGAVKNLEDEYVVVYYDQRATSMSEGHYPVKEDILSAMCLDFIALTEILKKRYGADINLFVIGHSLGGLQSGEALVRYDLQRQYKGWINLDGAIDIPMATEERREMMTSLSQTFEANSEQSEKWIELREEVKVTTDYDDVLRLAAKATALIMQEDVIPKVPRNEKIFNALFVNNPINWLINDLLNPPVKSIIESEYTLIADLNKLTIPTLFIYGKYDLSVPPNIGQLGFSNIQSEDKEFLLFEESMHHPHDTEPDRFSEEVIRFIELHR